MKQETSLIGLRVQIAIEEDGTPSPPSLPQGRIIRALRGTDSYDYYLVELDSPVQCTRARTGETWILTEVAITSHFTGIPIDRLLSELHGYFSDIVPVRIVKPLVPLEEDMPMFDLSKAEEFALGTVKRA